MDINNAWKSWKHEFLKICNKHAPIRSCRVKHASNPWITRDILDLINKKNFLHKKALNTRNTFDFMQYHRARNVTNFEIKNAKKSFFADKLKSVSSQSDMWKTLKSVLPSKQSQISDISLTAANFNSYFSSVGNRLTENIPLCSIADNDKCSNQHLKFNVISVLFITNCLATLKYNSSLGVLDMDGRLLKLAAKLLAPSITYIFNLSLQRGVIPDDLKLARITPKFKGKVIFPI